MSDSTSESHLVLLRLAPIKEALRTSEWNERKEKILSTAHRVIGETLGSEDAYTIHGGETCMIAFAKTTVTEAETVAAGISERIVGSLFGEFGLNSFPLQPQVLAIRDLLHKVNTDPDNLLHGILNQSGIFLGNRREHAEQLRREAEKLARRRRVLNLFEPEGPAEITHEYRSVWRVDDQTVDRFRYVPTLRKSPSELLVGYAVLGTTYAEADIVGLDIESVETAIIDLKNAVDTGRNVKLSVPMHFETLGSNHGRGELLKVLPVLPELFRRRISFTIDGIPDGIPESRLQEVIGILKPFSDSRAVALDAFPRDARALRSMLVKVRSIGMDTILVRVPRNASHEELKSVCNVVPQAAPLGLRTNVFSVTSGEEVLELVSAGCSVLSGPIFGGPFDELPEPYSVPASQFGDPRTVTRLPTFFSG